MDIKKSRGVLEIQVKRTFDKYGEAHLMPTMLFLAISWGVFWFPFQNPFITPRLALSILALLSFTNLVIKSSSELPSGAPANWNDVLNYQVQAMMFCTIVLNIFSEICKHQLKLEDLANQINKECKVLMPFISIIVLAIVLSAGRWKLLSVMAAAIVTKSVIMVVMGTYIGCSLSSLSQAHADQEAKSEEEKRKVEDAQLQHLKNLRGTP